MENQMSDGQENTDLYARAATLAHEGIDVPMRVSFNRQSTPEQDEEFWTAFNRHATAEDTAVAAEREGSKDPALAKEEAKALILREEIVAKTLAAKEEITTSNLAFYYQSVAASKPGDLAACVKVYEAVGAPTLAKVARQALKPGSGA
jgi:hypothetical protein